MKQNTSLTEKALNWWISGKVSFEDKCHITIKYFGVVKVFESDGVHALTDEEIETIYLKEHPTEAEVSNEEETVEQACKLHYENLMLSANKAAHNLYETGFYSGSNWKKEKDEIKLNENFDRGFTAGANEAQNRLSKVIEKDRELISELLERLKWSQKQIQIWENKVPALKSFNYSTEQGKKEGDEYLQNMSKTEQSITKAEKHLKNN